MELPVTEREKITRLAKESGFVSLDIEYIVDTVYPMFEAFYHKAQREAFEQTAKILDNGHFLTDTSPEKKWAEQVAAAIRQLIKE
jgi:hypothetical protein